MTELEPITRHFRQCRKASGVSLRSHKILESATRSAAAAAAKLSDDTNTFDSKKPQFVTEIRKPDILDPSTETTAPKRRAAKKPPPKTTARQTRTKSKPQTEISGQSKLEFTNNRDRTPAPSEETQPAVPSSPKRNSTENHEPPSPSKVKKSYRSVRETEVGVSEKGNSQSHVTSNKTGVVDNKDNFVSVGCTPESVGPRKVEDAELDIPGFMTSPAKSNNRGLYLPVKYQLLLDKFEAVDASVQLIFNRKELATFERVKQGVETITRRQFLHKDLSRMLTVWSAGYSVTFERQFRSIADKSYDYHMVLQPTLHLDKRTFLAAEILSRKRIFRQKLLDKCLDQHDQFIRRLSITASRDAVTSWHPNFNVEAMPDIAETPLPKMPGSDVTPRQGLNELIIKTREKATERMEKALAKLDSMTSPRSSPKSPKPSSTAVSGLSEKLRQKIAAKEALVMQQNLTSNAEERELAALKQKLPAVAKSLRVMFLADKRAAILHEDVVAKLRSSNRMSVAELSRSIDRIAELAPHWVSFVQVQGKKYVKVSKTVDFSSVVAILQK